MSKKFKSIKFKKTVPTEISFDVKMKVLKRDNGRCVVCGSTHNVEANAHYIPRSEGGMGIEENIVTLCNNESKNKCHYKFDFGTDEERKEIGEKIEAHLKKHYSKWSSEKVIYKKST